MLNVLILGANGFVGTHLSLVLKKNKKINLILGCRNPSKLLDELKGEKLRVGDLQDKQYLSTLFNDIDVLVNLASWASLFGEKESSKKLFLNPTIDIINKAKIAGVKKYISLSSTSIADVKEAQDANSNGRFRSLWPHFNNLVKIENHLRQSANDNFNVINLRCGLFTGKYYALGLLPILLPRLKTQLVPLVQGGNTQMPLTDGSDIAQAFVLAILSKQKFNNYECFNILGKNVPKVKDVLMYLHEKHHYPYPHFSVPFFIAYPFAHLMEILNPIMPFEPLIVRSIVHLLEDTNTDNNKAKELLFYEPKKEWRESIDEQVKEINEKQNPSMKMNKDKE